MVLGSVWSLRIPVYTQSLNWYPAEEQRRPRRRVREFEKADKYAKPASALTSEGYPRDYLCGRCCASRTPAEARCPAREAEGERERRRSYIRRNREVRDGVTQTTHLLRYQTEWRWEANTAIETTEQYRLSLYSWVQLRSWDWASCWAGCWALSVESTSDSFSLCLPLLALLSLSLK